MKEILLKNEVIGCWWLDSDGNMNYESSISGCSWDTMEPLTAVNYTSAKVHLIQIYKQQEKSKCLTVKS